MPPTLVVLAGPLKGQVVALTAGETSIGRDEANVLAIPDLALSRRHCVVQAGEGLFRIRDHDSLNGTFVNGLPVKERTLAHRDEIRIGASHLLFLATEEAGGKPAPSLPAEEEGAPAGSTVVLRRSDARYLQGPDAERDVADARVVRDLDTLLRVSRAFHVVRDRGALGRTLVELTLGVVPAGFGAILLVNRRDDDFDEAIEWSRDPERPVVISRTIARRVLLEGVALLCNDLPASEGLAGTQSAVASAVRSVLCAPLALVDKPLGVLYLGTADPAAPLDEHDLELVTAIAALAAPALENLRHIEWLEGEARRLEAALAVEHSMVGESARMRQVYQFVGRVASNESTVLIRGESGTGKELVARAVHMNSARAAGPFVPINCAALTETLLETELFGHERGAFTGAIAQKRGKLEVAHGGTILLDEVGELAPALQAKLLRVLQEREFERIGSTRAIKVDLRVIAATNRDLEGAIKEGRFRQDLYYRLNVVSVTMPALRERRDDIPLLASYFVNKYSERCKRPVLGISAEARACLLRYDWPGNVRELENAIERAVVLGSADRILPEDLPEAVLETARAPAPDARAVGPADVGDYHAAVNEAKRQVILDAVARAGGNYAQAARLLGLQPTYLHRLMRNLNLKSELR